MKTAYQKQKEKDQEWTAALETGNLDAYYKKYEKQQAFLISIPAPWVQDKDFRKDMFCKSPILLYMYLRSKIVRRQMKGKIDVKKEYYDKGKLACSIGEEVMARDCGWSVTTVKKYLNVLLGYGLIQKEVTRLGGRAYNTYIIGKISNGNEIYFIPRKPQAARCLPE